MPRKVAYSGKKKKEQLFQKRIRKTTGAHSLYTKDTEYDEGETSEDTEVKDVKLMQQPLKASGSGRNKNVNRYNLRLEGFLPLQPVTEKQREIDESFFKNYDFPTRQSWNYNMGKETLEQNENRYFREYVEELQKQHSTAGKEFPHFELNLETWRQLWRVLEISDILLIIVDVRYSTLMFPPSLYHHIVTTLKKHAILVLNKVDLVSPEAVVAWRHYFQDKYPGLPVVLFASYSTKAIKGSARGRIGHKRSMDGVYNIYKECKKIVQTEVDLSTWEQKILEDMNTENIHSDDVDQVENISADLTSHSDGQQHVMFRDGILTIGCIGFPNVGKSSLINALKGRKVVSVSRTPGHTKHFQTIFLTKIVRLCDCPGLVFPSSAPKHLQVLLGSYPISQLQVPYRSLKFLAEHINLPQVLKMQLPEDCEGWSATVISDAWALKRGFVTAKAARPDRARAANHLLRMCLAGQQQIILQFYPPNYHENKEKWHLHPEVEEVKKYQNIDDNNVDNSESYSSEEDDAQDDVHSAASLKTKNAFALLEDDI